MNKFADLIEENADEFAAIEALVRCGCQLRLANYCIGATWCTMICLIFRAKGYQYDDCAV